MPEKVGKVVQVIGPVVDIKFDSDSLPNLYNAINVDLGEGILVCEVEQHHLGWLFLRHYQEFMLWLSGNEPN